MLKPAFLAILLLPYVALGAPDASPAFSLTPGGLQLDAGAAGVFSISPPALNQGGGRATFTVSSTDTAVAKYSSGAELDYHLSQGGKVVTLTYSNLPPSAHEFKFSMGIPSTYAEGAKFSFNTEPLKPFPEDHPAQFVQNGVGGQFNFAGAGGAGFCFAGPGNWRGLQDDRFFGSQNFEYQFLWDVAAHPGENAFALCVMAMPVSGPIALSAAPEADAVPKASATPAAAATPRPPLKPLVDEFGQDPAKEFPMKVHSEEELVKDVAADKTYYDSLTPPETDTYGGLPGSGSKYGLKKTGFFHVQTIDAGAAGKRWVMVDPEGNIFFARGICPISLDDYTLLGGRFAAFPGLPPTKGNFHDAYQHGFGAIFSYYRANVIRKTGKPFSDEEQSGVAVTRARKWGFTNEGAFGSETSTMAAMSFPYIAMLNYGLPALPGQTKLRDPFTDGADGKIDAAFAKTVDLHVGDPLLIGYYLGNEEHFEDLPRLVPTLKGSAVAAKRRLVQMFQEKYGTIDKFNAAWQPKTPAKTFDELEDMPLSIATQEAADDMKAFQDIFTDTMYGLIAKVFRKHDPNHLLLGSRWQPSTTASQVLIRNAAKYMDVLSVNYYTYGIEPDYLKKIYQWSGKPLLMSEWHYGATDEGGHGATKTVKTQTERGMAYRNYVENVASLGFVVGAEWFSYNDQPLTGRFFEGYNGESGNIGLINVADRPYKDFLAEVMKTNYDIYPVVLGQRAPFEFKDPRFAVEPGGGRKEVDIPMALPGLKVDGSLSGWPGRPPESIPASHLVIGADAGTFQGSFRLCWDKDYLYVYVQITDENPMVNAGKGAALWGGDAIELFTGARDLEEGGQLAFTDRQLLLGASKETGSTQYYMGNAPSQPHIPMEVVKSVTGDGYTLEAAIPWNSLNIDPAEGKQFLFDIGVDDVATGKGRSRQFMWNGIARNSSDRSKWGIARLVK